MHYHSQNRLDELGIAHGLPRLRGARGRPHPFPHSMPVEHPQYRQTRPTTEHSRPGSLWVNVWLHTDVMAEPRAYAITFLVAGVGAIETELTLEELGDMKGSGQYANLPADIGDPEASRRILRTRLSYLLHAAEREASDLVIRDRDSREWIIPGRSLVAAHYEAPWDREAVPGVEIFKPESPST
jgi:hypothetical protein